MSVGEMAISLVVGEVLRLGFRGARGWDVMEVSSGTTQLGVHCLAMVTLVPVGVGVAEASWRSACEQEKMECSVARLVAQ
jgi:hypothetical protein